MNKWRANESSSIQVSQPTFKLTCIFVLIVSKLYIIMIAMGQMKILFQEEIAYMLILFHIIAIVAQVLTMKNSLDDWMNKYSNVIDKPDIDNFKNTFFIQFLSLVASVGMLLIDVLQ